VHCGQFRELRRTCQSRTANTQQIAKTFVAEYLQYLQFAKVRAVLNLACADGPKKLTFRLPQAAPQLKRSLSDVHLYGANRNHHQASAVTHPAYNEYGVERQAPE
jgi:hypothetical protein